MTLPMYRILSETSILRTTDSACIPRAEGNSDYQAFLEWEAEGNTPTPLSPGQFHTLNETTGEWEFQKEQAALTFCAQVDLHADKIYELFAMTPGRSKEYEIAEEQAKAFKDAGFVGEPGSFVTNWAEPAKMTNKEAAEDILRAAALFRYAIEEIRGIRLAGKEEIRAKRTLNTMLEALDRAKSNLTAIPASLATTTNPS